MLSAGWPRVTRRSLVSKSGTTSLPLSARSQGGGKLTLYMGPPEKTCSAIAQGFEKKSGIKPTFLRLSAGEAINRIRAERNSPQASILYGIGLPSMLTLKADGLRARIETLSRQDPSLKVRQAALEALKVMG